MALISPPSSIARAIIRRIRFVLTSLSFASAIFAIFIILSCKDVSGKKYSRLIIASVVLSFLFEMYLQLVLDPVYLFPTPCFLRDEPILRIPGRASTHNIIFVMLIQIDAPLIMTCFIHRHQAVMLPGSRWSFSTRSQLLPHLVLAHINIMIPTLLFVSFYKYFHKIEHKILKNAFHAYTEPPGSVHKYAEMFSENWPAEAIARTDCVYPEICAAICIWALISCCMSSLFFIVIVSHTFSSLHKHAVISGKLREYHLTMTRVLVIQSLVPVVFVILPLSIATLVFFVEKSHSLILPTCITIMSAHSFVHSLVVITTTPIYRRRILSLLRQRRFIRMRVSSLSSQKKGTDNIEIINGVAR